GRATFLPQLRRSRQPALRSHRWQLCRTLRGARQLARGDSEVRLSNDGVASVDGLRSMPGELHGTRPSRASALRFRTAETVNDFETLAPCAGGQRPCPTHTAREPVTAPPLPR